MLMGPSSVSWGFYCAHQAVVMIHGHTVYWVCIMLPQAAGLLKRDTADCITEICSAMLTTSQRERVSYFFIAAAQCKAFNV